MPSIESRFASKLARAFNKLAAPCQFMPVNGNPAYNRSVHLPPTDIDRSNEYIQAPILLAEFLRQDGAVNADDVFELSGKQYRLTQLHERDEITVSFVYLEL
ncbi:hypothetical protein [Shewanella sp. TB4-MNA-CIBAN-0142]|uniref:hypothetical protein n=1 Tax=Shewanella sp. TB4-MNA-CIBAN-0142 TaxID=3140464 RepID=UPI003330B8E2